MPYGLVNGVGPERYAVLDVEGGLEVIVAIGQEIEELDQLRSDLRMSLQLLDGMTEQIAEAPSAGALIYEVTEESRVPHEGHHAGGRPRSDASAARSSTWTVQVWRRTWVRITSTMKCSRSRGVFP